MITATERVRKPCRFCGAEYHKELRGSSPICFSCKEAPKQKTISTANTPDLKKRFAMAELYKQGNTLQKIGELYGVSRERVRQLIKSVGLSRKDGGISLASEAKRLINRQRVQAAKDSATMKRLGCTYNQALFWNDGKSLRARGSLAMGFWNQKHCATHARNIPWEMTFPEWVKVWKDSGKLNERGRSDSKSFCMARKGDTGPYAVGNVYITTIGSNVVDYQAELKIRGVVCPDGYRRLPERAEKLFGISLEAA